MSTTLRSAPTFSERVAGSNLIAIATLEGLLDVQPAKVGDRDYAFGYFDAVVGDVFKGDTAIERAVVRVVGEGPPDAPEWGVPVKLGTPMLMLLVRDVDEHQPDGVFVPSFGAAYPVSADGRVKLGKEILDDFTTSHAEIERGSAPVAGLRRVIDLIVVNQRRRRREFEDIEPADFWQRTEPAAIEELPAPGTRRTRRSTSQPPPSGDGVAGTSTDVSEGKPPPA